MATERPLRRLQVVGALLILLGLALLAGGVMLVVAGGSVAYLLAGIGFAASGALLWRGSSGALLVYAVLLTALLAWSLSEVGLDWWPLAARLDVAFVFGVLLVLPWIARPLAGPRRHRLVLGAAVAVSAVVAIVAGLRDPHEIAGELPQTVSAAATAPGDSPDGEWPAYGRTAAGQRWSPLAQITPSNVGELQVAWQFRTGDMRGRPGDPEETTDEVTPLKIGARLYFCTPHQSVIAFDATTGAQAWRYDPKMATGLALQHQTCRGLSYQPAAGAAAPAPAAASIASSGRALDIAANDGNARADCAAKLFLATADGRLIALDPETGAVCSRFGGGAGQIDLGAGMPNLNPGSYYSTSPVVVTKSLVIVGGTVLDNVSTKEESGVVRAYDIDTGALVWNWDSGNPDVTAPLAPGRQYTANSPNSWSIASVDEALGMVYLPMGNQPPDQWGGRRSPAVEKYSSSVVALDLATGKVRWVFQTVHHDLWDYDVPSQPSLIDLAINGSTVPALVQPTKQGELFVLDRRTGTPVLPVTEVRAPQGAAEGDHSAPTQPKSALSYEPPRLTDKDMWGATIVDQMACRIAFAKLRYEGRFTPPSTQGSLIYPGNFGTFNWGGVAVDPRRQAAFTTPTYLAFVSTLVPRPNATAEVVQGGNPPKGALPALNENFGAPFAVKLGPFTSPLGIPCQAPPWGYVAGADLTTGKIAWKHRNGTVRDLSPVPLPLRMGVPNLGGPVMTAGGVAFLSGSMDDYVRAYAVHDGRQLWESRLPAGGQATPMTYTGADGRQFLLVIAGGHGSTHTRPGDYVIAYALPKK
jgi:quinoprotein glucose dehydrogenase